MEEVIEIRGIGPVNFVTKTTCKNLRLTVKADNVVKITMPPLFPRNSAIQFVMQKKGWIIKQQLKTSLFKKGPVFFNETTVFNTAYHALNICRHNKSTIKTVIDKEKINVFYPGYADVMDPRIQAAVKNAILRTWKIEAETLLPGMVENLAALHGLKYSAVRIRNNKTRWGSCSGSNNISLNLHLVRLPAHLCTYVILHELTHTVHKNHGIKFWEMLDKLSGKAKQLDRELNSYRISVW
jgi:predicted metal-dependent hydrolase